MQAHTGLNALDRSFGSSPLQRAAILYTAYTQNTEGPGYKGMVLNVGVQGLRVHVYMDS